MTKISRRHMVPPPSRRTHGCNKLDVQKGSETIFFSVIPSTIYENMDVMIPNFDQNDEKT